MSKKYLLLLLISFFCQFANAQSTFQKQYEQPDSASALQTYDSKATPDGGYILTGHASEGSDLTKMHPFVLKLNCKGEKEWDVYFGLTQSTSNINPKIIVTKDSNYILINNLGTYPVYNGFAAKLDKFGNVIWQKTLNLSTGSDLVSDIIETTTGEILLVGSAKSTPDISLTKLTSSGNLIWNKTFGNNGNYDDGYTLLETQDGNYLIGGRFISMGTFNAVLLKTDTSGVAMWLKCYGDTLQHMVAYDIKESTTGDLFMVGSTTLLKPNYQSFSDNYIMKLNSVGDTIWTKIFYGNPDSYENISTIEFDTDDNIIVASATASYPTPGFIANKHAIMKFSPLGNLIWAKTYNNGSSHYPRISKAKDGTLIMSGFTNLYSNPVGFQSLLLKLDTTYSSGCLETDVTNLTTVTSIPFKITTPTFITAQSGTVTNNTTSFTTSIIDTTLCQFFPILNGIINSQNYCSSNPTTFSLDTSGLIYWHWDFGDLNSVADTSLLANVSYQYPSAGNYSVQLIISNGCETNTFYQAITITDPITNFSIGNDTIICFYDSILISANASGLNYTWNTSQTTQGIYVKNAGNYFCTANTPCGIISDTMVLTTKNCAPNSVEDYTLSECKVSMPTAFSPNGDGINDRLKPNVEGNQNQDFKFELMQVLNRWGNLIYSTTDVNAGWDGTYKGTMQLSDNYFYLIRYRCNGKEKVMKGDVLIVR